MRPFPGNSQWFAPAQLLIKFWIVNTLPAMNLAPNMKKNSHPETWRIGGSKMVMNEATLRQQVALEVAWSSIALTLSTDSVFSR